MLIKNFLSLKVSSFDSKLLNLFYFFLLNLFKKYCLQINKILFKKKKKKITLLKSAHVHKKSREQFQLTKFSFLILFKITPSKTIKILSLVYGNIPKALDVRFFFKSKVGAPLALTL